jgi:dolichol-phosphate mannosyltransferase
MTNITRSFSVVLPTLNESENITLLIDQIIKEFIDKGSLEIIVVDDDSTDKTAEKIREFRIPEEYCLIKLILIENRVKIGLGESILRGIQRASNDLIVVMDSDFTHQPKDIKNLLSKLDDNSIVIGSRYVEGGLMESWHLYLASKIYNRFLRFLLRTQTRDLLGGFFVFKKSHFADFLNFEVFSGYGDYFIWLIYGIEKYSKYPHAEIPVVFAERLHGRSKSRRISMLFSYYISARKCKKYFRNLNGSELKPRNTFFQA